MTPFEWLFLSGRILFAALFLGGGIGHFTGLDQTAEYAASRGVPAPRFMTLLTGGALLLGGLSVVLWIQVEVGTWLLAGFLLVSAFTIHDFWAFEDPDRREVEQAMFMKNVALAGAAVMLYAAAQAPDVVL